MSSFKTMSVFLFTFSIYFPTLFLGCSDDPSSPAEDLPAEDLIEEQIDNSDVPESILNQVKEFNEIIHQISGSSPNTDDQELSPLEFLKDVKFVGLGEATHGTKEFFQMKHRIFKYLVENYGFRVFGFEADMGESIYLNRIINGGSGRIKSEMSDKMHFWTWHTQEVQELLEWMKEYNTGIAENTKLHYIGLDCQFLTYQPILLRNFVSDFAPSLIDTTEKVVAPFEEIADTPYNERESYFDNLSTNEFNKLIESTNNLVSVFEDNESELVSNTTEYNYRVHKRLIVNMKQALEVIRNYNDPFTNENLRDKYMAENSEWILELFDNNVKSALWAHNGHLASASSYGGGGNMGYRLKFRFENNYQIIGFSFNKGSFSAIGQNGSTFTSLETQNIFSEPLSNTINELFHYSDKSNFIFRLIDLEKDSKLDQYLSGSLPFMNIGAVFNGNPESYYYPIPLKIYYDVMIHFQTTNHAVQLSRQTLGKSPALFE